LHARTCDGGSHDGPHRNSFRSKEPPRSAGEKGEQKQRNSQQPDSGRRVWLAFALDAEVIQRGFGRSRHDYLQSKAKNRKTQAQTGAGVGSAEWGMQNSFQFCRCGSKSVWCEIIFHAPFSLRKTFVARMRTVNVFPS